MTAFRSGLPGWPLGGLLRARRQGLVHEWLTTWHALAGRHSEWRWRHRGADPPSATSSFAIAHVVLAISTALDLMSIRQSAGQMARRARRYHREFLRESRVTSDPSLRAVFVEDAVSVGGTCSRLPPWP